MMSLRLLALFLVCAGTARDAQAGEQRTRVGRAYDVDSGGLVYVPGASGTRFRVRLPARALRAA